MSVDDVSMDEGLIKEQPSSEVRKVKGRGGRDVNDQDDRYQGRGGIFESLEEDQEARADKDGPLKSIEGWIVIVTGVHEECAEDDIYAEFEEFGEIKNLHMNLDRRTGFVKGYALIEYENYKEAKSAIENMSGKEICGTPVYCSWAFTRPSS